MNKETKKKLQREIVHCITMGKFRELVEARCEKKFGREVLEKKYKRSKKDALMEDYENSISRFNNAIGKVDTDIWKHEMAKKALSGVKITSRLQDKKNKKINKLEDTNLTFDTKSEVYQCPSCGKFMLNKLVSDSSKEKYVCLNVNDKRMYRVVVTKNDYTAKNNADFADIYGNEDNAEIFLGYIDDIKKKLVKEGDKDKIQAHRKAKLKPPTKRKRVYNEGELSPVDLKKWRIMDTKILDLNNALNDMKLDRTTKDATTDGKKSEFIPDPFQVAHGRLQVCSVCMYFSLANIYNPNNGVSKAEEERFKICARKECPAYLIPMEKSLALSVHNVARNIDIYEFTHKNLEKEIYNTEINIKNDKEKQSRKNNKNLYPDNDDREFKDTDYGEDFVRLTQATENYDGIDSDTLLMNIVHEKPKSTNEKKYLNTLVNVDFTPKYEVETDKIIKIKFKTDTPKIKELRENLCTKSEIHSLNYIKSNEKIHNNFLSLRRLYITCYIQTLVHLHRYYVGKSVIVPVNKYFSFYYQNLIDNQQKTQDEEAKKQFLIRLYDLFSLDKDMDDGLNPEEMDKLKKERKNKDYKMFVPDKIGALNFIINKEYNVEEILKEYRENVDDYNKAFKEEENELMKKKRKRKDEEDKKGTMKTIAEAAADALGDLSEVAKTMSGKFSPTAIGNMSFKRRKNNNINLKDIVENYNNNVYYNRKDQLKNDLNSYFKKIGNSSVHIKIVFEDSEVNAIINKLSQNKPATKLNETFFYNNYLQQIEEKFKKYNKTEGFTSEDKDKLKDLIKGNSKISSKVKKQLTEKLERPGSYEKVNLIVTYFIDKDRFLEEFDSLFNKMYDNQKGEIMRKKDIDNKDFEYLNVKEINVLKNKITLKKIGVKPNNSVVDFVYNQLGDIDRELLTTLNKKNKSLSKGSKLNIGTKKADFTIPDRNFFLYGDDNPIPLIGNLDNHSTLTNTWKNKISANNRPTKQLRQEKDRNYKFLDSTKWGWLYNINDKILKRTFNSPDVYTFARFKPFISIGKEKVMICADRTNSRDVELMRIIRDFEKDHNQAVNILK